MKSKTDGLTPLRQKLLDQQVPGWRGNGVVAPPLEEAGTSGKAEEVSAPTPERRSELEALREQVQKLEAELATRTTPTKKARKKARKKAAKKS